MFGRKHSDAAKHKVSTKNQGKVPHNRGKKVCDPNQLAAIQLGVAARDARYQQDNCHPKKGAVLSADTRNRISLSLQNYAKANPEQIKARAQQALQTKIAKGFDFGSPMRGKSHTDDVKLNLSIAANLAAQHKTAAARIRYGQFAAQANLVITGYSNNIVSLSCQTCNNPFEFTAQYLTDSKFQLNICPYCREQKVKSRAEVEILDFVRSVTSTLVLSGNRSAIFPLELDIYLPDKHLAIEYCGLYWHSQLQGKDQRYHLHKLQQCTAHNIRLITIFEDEWTHNSHIVKSRLMAILNATPIKIGARHCSTAAVDNKTARDFCQQHHIQGQGSASASVGLFHNSTLVAVMTFSRPNISKGSRKYAAHDWELNRFCSAVDHNIVGGASKLFQQFVRQYQPASVITYADQRWNSGNVYKILGFDFVANTPPSYWYIDFPNVKRLHRFALRKTFNDDPSLTEWDNRQAQGWNRIWDCGNSKWIWKQEP